MLMPANALKYARHWTEDLFVNLTSIKCLLYFTSIFLPDEHFAKMKIAKEPMVRLCKICNRKIPGNKANWEIHIKGRRHVQSLPEHFTITSIPNELESTEISKYFTEFGPLAKFELTDPAAIKCTFEDRSVLSTVLQQDEHIIKNHTVAIQWEKPVAGEPNAKKTRTFKSLMPAASDKTFQKAALVAVNGNLSFAKAVDEFVKFVRAQQAQADDARKTIIDDLTALFAPHQPKLFVYGSRLTKTDFDTSDYNFFIANLHKEHDKEPDTLEMVRQQLDDSPKFDKVVVGASAVQCVHKTTEGKCEISVRSMAPVYSSEFLRYYFNLDKKVSALILLLKFWLQIRGFLSKASLSSYDLHQMVIVYLQQPPLSFPTLEQLQTGAPTKIQDGHTFGFNPTNFRSQKLDEMTITDLFTGFLKFYVNFDYFNYVICPYSGKLVAKSAFLDGGDAFTPSFGLSIQDPFQHDVNTTQVSFLHVPAIIHAFRSALATIGSGSPSPLHRILTDQSVRRQEHEIYEFRRLNQDGNCELDRLWFEKVRNLMVKIGTKVFLGKVRMQAGHVVEVGTGGEQMVQYRCTAEKDVWEGRMAVMKRLWPEMKAKRLRRIEREALVSIEFDKVQAKCMGLVIHFNIAFKRNPCKVVIYTTAQHSAETIFDHVKAYLKFFLPQFMVELQEETATSEKCETAPDPAAAPKPAEQQNATEAEADREDAEATEILDEILLDDNFLEGLEVIDACDDDFPIQNDKSTTRSNSKNSSPYEKKGRRSRTNDDRHRSRSLNRYRHPSPPASIVYPHHSHTFRTGKVGELVTRPEKRRANRRSWSREEADAKRRDPEKTRRDISRDKAKVARDEEKKTHLELMQGGLVPPGLESEVMLSARDKRERSWEREESGGGAKRAKKNGKENDLRKYHESFLKEVQEKLNEVRAPQMVRSSGGVKSQDYDESFFIGNSYQGQQMMQQQQQQQQHWAEQQYMQPVPQPLMMMNAPMAPMPIQHNYGMGMEDMLMFNPPAPFPANVVPSNSNFSPNVQQVHFDANAPAVVQPAAVFQPVKNVEKKKVEIPVKTKEIIRKIEEKNDVAKNSQNIGQLFADKKISLSDFLTISAKPEVQLASTEQLQKKIELISRVQDVIRTMSEGRNFSAGIIIKPVKRIVPPNKAHQSPLHRIQKIRFLHTTPPEGGLSPFESAVNHILIASGIIKKSVRLDPTDEAKETSAKLAEKAKQDECKECMRRKAIEYATIGTQVTNEDLAPLKEVKKTQESLMHMTPAQLLGASPRPHNMAPYARTRYGPGHFEPPQRNMGMFEAPPSLMGLPPPNWY